MRNFSIIVLLLCCIVYWIIGESVSRIDFFQLQLLGSFGLCQFAFSIYSSLKTGQKIISPYVIFLFGLYVFSFGQSLLYPFGVISERDLDGFMGISKTDIFQTQLITLAFLAFFQIGSLMYHGKVKAASPSSNRYIIENKNLKHIGWLLFAVSCFPYYNELISNAILSLLYGYGALYEVEAKIGADNFLGILSDYFIPSIICLYVAYRYNRKWRLFFISILGFNSAVLLVTGGRSEAVLIIALVLVLHNYLVKPFTRKTLVVIAGLSILLLALLTTISQIRSNPNRFSGETYRMGQSDNAAVNAIGEMGWSMFCLVKTSNIVPAQEDYRYGSTYAYAFTSLIPNMGFWQIHPAKKGANMANWLSDTLGTSFGTGFSMCAEAYINFGYFGVLIMLFLGYIISSFFNSFGLSIKTGNIAFVAFTLIIFWFSLKMPRNSFLGIVRGVFYFALPVYWFTRGYIIKTNR